jgi:hypothetical protein
LLIKPRRLVVDSSPKDGLAYDVRVYAFYIGQGIKPGDIEAAKDWRPLSYSDAESGILTNIKTGEVRTTGFFREQDEDHFIRMTLSSSPVVLVAVNAMDRYYAWRVFNYEIPMPHVEIVLRFLLNKSTAETPEYRDSLWSVVAEKYETAQ